MKLRGNKGFTLIELLLVILIIIGLAAIVVPNYMKVSDESDTAVDSANREALRAAARLLVLDAGLTAVAGSNINGTLSGPDLADSDTTTYTHGPYIEGGSFPTPPASVGTSYSVILSASTGAIAITVVP